MVVIVASILFIVVNKRWATWVGIVGWGIGFIANLPHLPEYLVASAILIPIAILLRWACRPDKSSKAQ
jgi:hypothetical protein